MAEQPVEARLIDTSVWIRADRKGQDAIQRRLKNLVISGAAYICWPIRTELQIGVRNDEGFRYLDGKLSALPHLPLTEDIWKNAARAGQKLARRGQTVPLIDLLISSIAIEGRMILWSVDSDFKRVAANTDLRMDWFGME